MSRSWIACLTIAIALAGCGRSHGGLGADVDASSGSDAASGSGGDARVADAGGDGAGGGDGGARGDGGSGSAVDGGGSTDAGAHDAAAGILSGGPCMSGAAGATAYRIRWTGAEGGTATVVYEVDGLPDHARDHASAAGFQIGFTPTFTDTFLGDGGVQLDGSDFIDLEITTAGVSSISSATLAIFGRSFDTTASGSFNWQTFDGTGASASDLVSNVAPYAWYAADMTTEISPGDSGVLIRIKAGPSSDSLVVNRIELCMQAN